MKDEREGYDDILAAMEAEFGKLDLAPPWLNDAERAALAEAVAFRERAEAKAERRRQALIGALGGLVLVAGYFAFAWLTHWTAASIGGWTAP